MLTQLRNSAQSWLIKALLGVIVVSFVISFGVGTFSNPKEVLVEVDSHEIMVSQFDREYRDAENNLRQQYPENFEALATQLNLREQVMKQMVNRFLILRAAERAGLRVTDREVQAVVTENPVFQVNNQFNFETYSNILSRNQLGPSQYESRLKDDLLVTKHQESLLAGMVIGDGEVDNRYRVENEQVEVDYLYVDPIRFKPPPRPSDQDIKDYFGKNSKTFTQPAQFKVRFFILGMKQLEKGVSIRPRAIERYYQRNLEAEFSTPKQVRASHILMRIPEGGGEEKEKEVRAEMEKILAQAREGGDFAKLARGHSQDLSKDKGGDLGFFSKADMVPAFAEAAFALSEGGISNLVRTPFGLHIIKVTGVKPGIEKPLEGVRGEIEEKLKSRRAERKLEVELGRLPRRVQKDGIEKISQEFKARLETTESFGAGGVVTGLGSTGLLYSQIKNRSRGHTGVWRRNPVLGHVFYEVTEKIEAYVKPLDTVRAQVVSLILASRRREAALSDAKTVLDTLKTGADFPAYAKRRSLATQTVSFTVVDRSIEGLGVNPDFQRSAFKLTPEKPFALNIKDGKAYLMYFKRRFFKEPAREKEIKEQIRRQLDNAYRQYLLESEIKRLRAGVEINVLVPEYVRVSAMPPVYPRRVN